MAECRVPTNAVDKKIKQYIVQVKKCFVEINQDGGDDVT
jgi:hypothetical protein